MAKEKKVKTTLQKYKGLKRTSKILKAGTVATPVVPAVVITVSNWKTWFGKAGVSLPLGFSILLATTVLAVICILKSETILKKKDIVLLCLGMLFFVIGIVNLFFASLLSQLGFIFVSIGAALCGSFIEYTVDVKVIQPKINDYAQLVEKYALNPKSQKKKQAEEQAQKEAEIKAQEESRENKRFGGMI